MQSLLLHIIGRRMIPIPEGIDSFHVVSEIEPSEMSALEAVLSVDKEREAMEAEAERISAMLETAGTEVRSPFSCGSPTSPLLTCAVPSCPLLPSFPAHYRKKHK